ncbi:MAG: ABC transporter substrate-binding protein [Ignavibacteriales bacterium]
MKKIAYLLLVLMVLSLTGCGNQAKTTPQAPKVTEATILNPVGPLVFTAAGLEDKKVDTKGLDIKVNYWKTNDEAIALLSSKRAEFAVLPVTMAANLSASGIKLKMLGVHEWKVFYMVAAPGTKYTSFKDLKGQQIYVPVGKGSTIDVLLTAALNQAGLKPGVDANVVYAPPQEIVALFKSGKVKYAALPEPFVTLASMGGKGQVVVDFQKYWAQISGSPERMPIAGLFVTDEFATQHPTETAQVADAFAASIDWGNKNVDKALLVSSKTLPVPAPAMKAALARIEFKYVAAADCQAETEAFLKKMQELDPTGIKQIPGADFYAK